MPLHMQHRTNCACLLRTFLQQHAFVFLRRSKLIPFSVAAHPLVTICLFRTLSVCSIQFLKHPIGGNVVKRLKQTHGNETYTDDNGGEKSEQACRKEWITEQKRVACIL